MEEDIYGDLENYNDVNALDELRKENQQLKFKVEEYASTIVKLQKDFDKVNLEFKTMEINFSSLLKTARAEIERKTQIINNLNKEKDKLVFSALQNNNRNILNIKRNLDKTRSLSRGNRDSEGSKLSGDCSETRKLETERGRKDENRLPSIDTESSLNTEESNKISSNDTIQAKKTSHRTDETKENVSDIKCRSQSIRNRRKSMPAANYPKFSSDEEDVNYSQKDRNKLGWYLKDDKHRKASETSGIDDKYSSYHESSRDTNYYRDSFGRTNDRYRSSWNRRESPQRQKRIISPERTNRWKPKDLFDERSRNVDRGRHRRSESPPVQKQNPYHRNRSRERRSNVERARYDRSRSRHERYGYKHKLLDYEEPPNKRQRTDSLSRHFDDVLETRDNIKEKSIPKSLENVQHFSCQSPDVMNTIPEVIPTKEFSDSAATNLSEIPEDPRLSSNRYTKHFYDDKVVFVALSGQNVDLIPIYTSEWDIRQVEVPEALRHPPDDTERLVSELYGDIDPVCSASVESGELQSDFGDYPDDVGRERQYTNEDVQISQPDKVVAKSVVEERVQEELQKNTKRVTQYKIPKMKSVDKESVDKCESAIAPNALDKESAFSDYPDDVGKKRQYTYLDVHINEPDKVVAENIVEKHVQEKLQENTTKPAHYKIPKVKRVDEECVDKCKRAIAPNPLGKQSDFCNYPDNVGRERQYTSVDVQINQSDKVVTKSIVEKHVQEKLQEKTTKAAHYKIPKVKRVDKKCVDKFERAIDPNPMGKQSDFGDYPDDIATEIQQTCEDVHIQMIQPNKVVSESIVENVVQVQHVQEKLEENTTKSTQYKKSKIKRVDKESVDKCESAIAPNPLGKLLSEFNITTSIENIKNRDKLDVDKFYSPDKDSIQNEPVITNSEVLNKVKKSLREMVEGDLELSDETSDNVEIVKIRKSRLSDGNDARKSEDKVKDSESQTSADEKKKPITLKIAKDKNTQYHCIEQKEVDTNKSISESNTKHKTKKKVHKTKRKSQEVNNPTETNEKTEKKTSKSKKEPKPKEIKAKLNELFGESSSLITPEDLGAVTKHGDAQPSNKYVPIFEDAQDAIDMSLTPIKSDVVSVSTTSTENNRTAYTETEFSMTKSKNKLNESHNHVDTAANPKAFVNLNPGPLVPEPDVVSTVIISSGVQPQVAVDELPNFSAEPFLGFNVTQKVDYVHNVVSADIQPHAESMNTVPPAHYETVQKEHNLCKDKPEIFKAMTAPVAIATSTPHKSIHKDEVISRVLESSCNSSDGKIIRNEESEISCQSNENGDLDDVPDVRIFVKRRRKFPKKTVSK